MKVNAKLFFAGELAELLTTSHDMGVVSYPVDRRASIKDVIEAIGVPHTEVYSIHSSGTSHDFSLILEQGMSVAFLPARLSSDYPVDVTVPTLIRPSSLDALRFLVDENVAGLVPLLRVLGFDTAYDRKWSDEEIVRHVVAEQRVLLSRDRALLKRSDIVHGRLIRSQVVDGQLIEVLGHFRTSGRDTPFSRCLKCNEIMERVDKKDIMERLEPKTKQHFDSFKLCPACDQIFWAGSHYVRLMDRLRKLGLEL